MLGRILSFGQMLSSGKEVNELTAKYIEVRIKAKKAISINYGQKGGRDDVVTKDMLWKIYLIKIYDAYNGRGIEKRVFQHFCYNFPSSCVLIVAETFSLQFGSRIFFADEQKTEANVH